MARRTKISKRQRQKRRARKMGNNKAQHFLHEESKIEEVPPQSFVIHQGTIGSRLQILVKDFKRVMKPHTAEKLRATKLNSVSDFAAMSGPMKVTHLIAFNHSSLGANMRIARLPQGPTLTFRIKNYSLTGDVLSTLKKEMTYGSQFMTAPCLMTNLQPSEGEKHLQLCAQMFLDMFPTIRPTHIKLKDLKRCCLINYDADNCIFDFRHYAIRTRPSGVSKAVRKLLGPKVPNLQKLSSVSDFVEKADLLSDSEGEEDSKETVLLRKKVKGEYSTSKCSIKLTEIGPRLTLKLLKIEEGLCDGTVLYHRFHSKTAEELMEIKKKKELYVKLKEKRRKEQMDNVKRKLAEKEKHKQKCLDGMKRKWGNGDSSEENEEKQKDDMPMTKRRKDWPKKRNPKDGTNSKKGKKFKKLKTKSN